MKGEEQPVRRPLAEPGRPDRFCHGIDVGFFPVIALHEGDLGRIPHRRQRLVKLVARGARRAEGALRVEGDSDDAAAAPGS